jgi:hypothetical protein
MAATDGRVPVRRATSPDGYMPNASPAYRAGRGNALGGSMLFRRM